jgi:ABC-type multidrug transport system fused ATPase/permease subunit
MLRTFPDADPGTPDVRGPWRYLVRVAAGYWRLLLLASVFNAMWAAAQGVSPGLIGEAINAGLIARNQGALVWWGMAILGVGIVQTLSDAIQERFSLSAKIGSGYQTLQFVTRQACELGATANRRVSAGDLVTVGVSDINQIGQAMDLAARGVGAAVAVAVVAALMLAASWQVGLLVLTGVPVILLITTRLTRLLRHRQNQLRAQQRDLTDQAVDIVRGLTVLRGFGGEEMFAGRYRDGSQQVRFASLRLARVSAMLGAVNSFLPSLLLVSVVALSANLVLARQLSVGQMVAFYGYAAFLPVPLNRMNYAISKAAQAHVAAGHITRLLRLKPDVEPGPGSISMPGSGALADPVSGLLVPADGLTAVVCTVGDATALSDRLGRYTDSGATYGGQPLTALPLADVRKRILVTTVDACLFAGRLRHELDPADRLDESDDPLWAAVDASAARDIVEALPHQLNTIVAAGGQEFSGGQQQRLRLVRALMADPEVLILIDPTSAVDAHTESKMTAGIVRLRRGRTTLVFTTSILLLSQADRVVLVIDGRVVAQGSHESLMGDARYRSLVERGMVTA